MEFDYGELSSDTDFVENCEMLKANLDELQKVLDQLLPLKKQYDKLTLPAQIELDLFLAFTLTSLHWIHLRVEGVDPTTQPIKEELERLKEAMLKWQEIKDKEKRPIVNVEAAKRFIRSGLYDPYRRTAKAEKKVKKFFNED